MKTLTTLGPAWGVCVVLSSFLAAAPESATARDLIRIPIPSPERAIRRARGVIHRAVGEVAGNQRPAKRSSGTQKSKSEGAPQGTTASVEATSPTTVANAEPEQGTTLNNGVAAPANTPQRNTSAPATTSTKTAANSKDSAAKSASAPNPSPQVARPVPGKKGLVYPPGEEDSPAAMIDVRDMPSGQLVRDPRTGKVFRVP